MGDLIIIAFTLFVIRVIRRDTTMRSGISAATWVPTLWVGILASRPVSMWFSMGTIDTTEGSPMDAAVYFALILAAGIILVRRGFPTGRFLARNWPVTLFYGFLLVSVVWSHSTPVSFKRWYKEAGNIVVACVILTEANPQQAFRAVFVRCAYVLIPMSDILLRWFGELGRAYNIYSGEMEAVGVTNQKNSLGAMVLVCGTIMIWDLFEVYDRRRELPRPVFRRECVLRLIVISLGYGLLTLCDSKTSIVCVGLATAVLVGSRIRWLRSKVRYIGAAAVLTAAALLLSSDNGGLKGSVFHALGRKPTLTGRTEVWQALIAVKTNPMLGTGFGGFWDNAYYRSKLPYFVGASAHNGYIEAYLFGGWFAVFFVAVMMLASAARIWKAVGENDDYAFVRFATLIVPLLANITESNIAEMTPVGFLFLVGAMEMPAGWLPRGSLPASAPAPTEMPAHEEQTIG